MNIVRADDCAFVPWRNGGGRTRELLAWPNASDWRVRVSVAEIESDGPFSAFDGIERCFAVLGGAGVILSLPQGDTRLTPHDDAVSFAGEAAPMCRLIDGPTRDLNLMVRRGAGKARIARAPPATARWRGVFADGTLRWSDDPLEAWPALTGWHLSA
jgi:uncharacterized protein